MRLDEFSLIDRIAARTASREDVLLGIGDDCALLQPTTGEVLAVTSDTLNAGVHFPEETDPFDIGWKTLAVNLSDLAAMGARPAWCTLAMSLPDSDPLWLKAFTDGLFALADAEGIALIGGDTTRGPLSLSVTAMGWVPADSALRRDGAQAGDAVWVSGVPGEAAAALQLWQLGVLAVETEATEPGYEALRQRLVRPTPRTALGRALRGIATAAIDISDGLTADMGHICRRSGVGAVLSLDRLPRSSALDALLPRAAGWLAQTSGGDDYELCFTARETSRAQIMAIGEQLNLPLTCIGTLVPGNQVHWQQSDGAYWSPNHAGYDHFAVCTPAVKVQ